MAKKTAVEAKHLDSVSQFQRERLANLELEVCLAGELSRTDTEVSFGAKPGAVSQDLTLYRLSILSYSHLSGARSRNRVISREIKHYVLDAVRNGFTSDPDNNLRDYIEFGWVEAT